MFLGHWQPSPESTRNGPDSFVECFEKLDSGFSLQEMGFTSDTTLGQIRRFCYRWRFANSFKGLELKDYHESTIMGYTALTKVFFTFSVLERFVKFIGQEWHSCASLIPQKDIDTLNQLFHPTDYNDGLTHFLSERVNYRLNQRLINLKGGTKSEIMALGAAIRHIFAHGHLTAHPGGVDSELMCIMNLKLSKVMLDLMNREFSKKVNSI